MDRAIQLIRELHKQFMKRFTHPTGPMCSYDRGYEDGLETVLTVLGNAAFRQSQEKSNGNDRHIR